MQTTASAAESQTSCPICSGPSRHCFVVGPAAVWACGGCQHHFSRHPLPGRCFASAADRDAYLADERRLRARTQAYIDRLASWGIRPSEFVQADQRPRLLSVGTAAGFDLDQWRRAGWEVTGIEPDEALARLARQRLGLDVLTSTLESMPRNQTFELVTAMRVFGSFVNPRLASDRLAALVRPGGWLLVETDDCRSWPARWQGRRWSAYRAAGVSQWFSPSSLQRLLAGSGFQAAASGGRPTIAWFSRYYPSLFRGLTLPCPGNDIFWTLFAKTGNQRPLFTDEISGRVAVPAGTRWQPAICSEIR